MEELNDDYILKVVRDEKRVSIGFDDESPSSELQVKRLFCLEYYKGDMSRDMPPIPGRSQPRSNDVASNIDQILPNLVDIFMDEDCFAFRPLHQGDIDAAQQATDYINHLFFKRNDGFGVLHHAIHDALLVGVGYFVWDWCEPKEPETETFKNMGIQDLINASNLVDQGKAVFVDAKPDVVKDGEEPTVTFTLAAPKKQGYVKVQNWNPGDVAVSSDTVKLGDGSYCSFRRRARRFELVHEGFDEDVVATLPRASYIPTLTDIARDEAGEYSVYYGQSSITDMDTVLIYYSYLRVPQTEKLIKAITSGDDGNLVLLKWEEVDSIPASAICPFPKPHRFYGEGLAERLLETQRQKTAWLRLMQDQGYYSMIGRMEVAEDGIGKNTMADLFNNSHPGGFVRTKSIGSVQPLQTASANFPGFDMLEYLSTQGELTSGVMRASQGLAADSLHETKGGALALLNQSQIRTRFMAKNIAESGVKDMVLGIYQMVRENCSQGDMIKVNNQWVMIDPTSWDERDQVDIEIANAGGRDYDVAGLTQLLNVSKEIIQMQQGVNGPIQNAGNIAYILQQLTKAMGRKDADQIFAAPQQAMALMQQHAQQPPKPDPETQKVQAEMQLQQQKQQAEAMFQQQKLKSDQQAAQSKFQMDMEKAQEEFYLKKYQIDEEIKLKTYQTQQELSLKEQEIHLQAKLDLMASIAHGDTHTALPPISPGGDPG